VKRRPHWRKENQCVMNRQQSTSISGKPHLENHKGEGNTPSVPQLICVEPNGLAVYGRAKRRRISKTLNRTAPVQVP
jgi:hypothetical protein